MDSPEPSRTTPERGRPWLPGWMTREQPDPERAAGIYAVRSLVGVLCGCVVAVLMLVLMYPGLRFTAERPQRTSLPAPSTSAEKAALARAKAAPAARVVAELLKPVPAGMPGGLVDSSSVTGTVAPAVALTCDSPAAPVLSRSRTWAAQGGSAGVTVTVSVYSAGAGAPVMDAMLAARKQCRGEVTVSGADGYGVQSIQASLLKGQVDTRSVVFRRGDVLVSVSGTGMPMPQGAAHDLDTRLASLLQGVCVDQSSTAQMFVRSPLIGRPKFIGYQVPQAVDLPGRGTPLPDVATPHVGVPLPDAVTPTAPAPPYWPESAPAPVPSPTEPAVPSPYPVRTSYLASVRDDQGPGCGWAFTGMSAPVFDEAAAAAANTTRRDAGIAAMQAAVAAYPGEVEAYEKAWTTYQQQATAWTTYVAQAQQVEATWSVIRAQQQAYRDAVTSYQAAMQAYQQQTTQRAALEKAYEDALAACAAGSAPTQPAPTSTDPWATPAPSDGGSQPPGCPPQRDPVLDLPAPTPPVSPTPPPDPRPTPRP